ncbi:hypothetical protein UFOVP1565_28 [uncultured Caudovirales phage]|uniref:Uncharacterized protein n=1 Tax=uncultured Caudovirales phage TaxID=2100421 RepID=A0A6J5LTE1_9CAUD|nr:hypothetical protein UFOVP311_2 [uncultured Caudovirales phage]CAB4203995.1 hypothetical protein UFOVP1388_23 [uncultured Caudovirales phage]CAB5229950.1 hypothetical protein UFOVP1565_28 [uncultured Caudovirales phage]
MAIDLFEELWQERKGTLDKSYQNTFSRSFIVHTDTLEQTDINIYDAIYGHPNCPQIGDLFPGDDDSYAQSVNITPEQDDPQTWKVTIEYSSNPDATSSSPSGSTPPPAVETQQTGQKPEDREAEPTLRPPDFKVNFVSFPYIVPNINNSAGDPFVPPITVEKFRPVFSIGCNVSTIDSYDLATYIGKVNSSTVTFATGTGCTLRILAKTGKIKNINTELLLEGSFQYWRLTYEIEINTSLDPVDGETVIGWDMHLLDMGYRIRKDDGERAPIFEGGVKITQPVRLNGAGKKTAAGAANSYVVFASADVYGTIDFATLPGLGFF